MLSKLSCCCFLLFGGMASAQFDCPTIDSPMNGDRNVPVDATITWTAVEGVPSYIISLGTAPNGTDIVDSETVGGPSFTPDLGLPQNSDIYVTITLFFFNEENITCPSEMFRTLEVTTPPPCSNLNTPLDGSTGVAINTILSWDQAPTATAYTISMGTSPRASDLLADLEIIGSLSYDPDFEFPTASEIYVRIIPLNDNGPTNQACQEYRFTTGEEIEIPECTMLNSPQNGEFNVPLTPLLEWDTVPGADGYRIAIGTTTTNNNIVNNAIFSSNTLEVIDFLPNTRYFVTVTPFNQAGDATDCLQTSFTTRLGCGPIEDPITGELISFNPIIEFPQTVPLCLNDIPTLINSTTIADGHRWYKIDNESIETLLSETAELSLFEEGQYRYEAYNLITQEDDTFECSASNSFTVSASELPSIENIEVVRQGGLFEIIIEVEGTGIYDYALDFSDGPYQTENRFTGVPKGSHTVYVRDRNGCGIVQEDIYEGLTKEGFPLFFTPNGDGINDFWQFNPKEQLAEEVLDTIFIFNRYGVLLARIAPNTNGWDGSLNGSPLPSADYWFKAIATDKKIVKGHFTLKR